MNLDEYVMLSESMGVPIEVYDLTNKLVKSFIKEKNKRNKIVDKDGINFSYIFNSSTIKDSFVDEIFLQVNISSKDFNSFYNYNLSNWDNINKKFKNLVIKISLSFENIKDFKEIISHELLHAFEDYKRRIGDNMGLTKLDGEYTSFQTKTLTDISINFTKPLKYIEYFLYYLMSIEKRANVTQLYFELKKMDFNIEDIKSKRYKELSFYKIYNNIKDNGDLILNSLNDEELKLLNEHISKIKPLKSIYSKDNNKMISNLKKYFKLESEKVLKKMNKVLLLYIDEEFVNNYIKNYKYKI